MCILVELLSDIFRIIIIMYLSSKYLRRPVGIYLDIFNENNTIDSIISNIRDYR